MDRRMAMVTVVVVCVGIAFVAAWLLPPAGPLCCGGSSQVGRYAKLLAARSSSGVVVWDAWKKRTWMLPGSGTGSAQAAILGNALVTVDRGVVLLGDMHTGRIDPVGAFAQIAAREAMVSADGRFIAAEGEGPGGSGVWRLDRDDDSLILVSIRADGERIGFPRLLAFSADGRYAAIGEDHFVYVFDAFRGTTRVIWPKP